MSPNNTPQGDVSSIEDAIKQAFPNAEGLDIKQLSALLANTANGYMSEQEVQDIILAYPQLSTLFNKLAQQMLASPSSLLLGIGTNSQTGDIQLRDVAGGSIINLVVNYTQELASKQTIKHGQEDKGHKSYRGLRTITIKRTRFLIAFFVVTLFAIVFTLIEIYFGHFLSAIITIIIYIVLVFGLLLLKNFYDPFKSNQNFDSIFLKANDTRAIPFESGQDPLKTFRRRPLFYYLQQRTQAYLEVATLPFIQHTNEKQSHEPQKAEGDTISGKITDENIYDDDPFFLEDLLEVGQKPEYTVTERYDITQKIVIGRSELLADIVIVQPWISRVHCTITPKRNYCHLMDNGSANGTYLNGKKLPEYKSVQLRHRDKIVLGNYTSDKNRSEITIYYFRR